jgi:hypothetical protein
MRRADGQQESTQQSRRNLDDEGFRCHPRLAKTGATGKTIATKIGRSGSPFIRRRDIEDISLSARPTVRRSAGAKKAKAVAASKRRRSR